MKVSWARIIIHFWYFWECWFSSQIQVVLWEDTRDYRLYFLPPSQGRLYLDQPQKVIMRWITSCLLSNVKVKLHTTF